VAPSVPVAAPVQATNDMEAIVFAAADEFGVPRDLARATMGQESGGNPSATSYVGAAGLLQVMPATAAGIAAELGMASYDLYDPQTNARFGMYYLAGKLARYGSVDWALAAYNWGPGAVDGFLSRHPEAQSMAWADVVAAWGGEIPAETQGYVRSITAAMVPAQASAAKCRVTDTMAVTAHFGDTRSGHWSGYAGGQHNGTDYAGNPGDLVYAPFGMTVEDVGYYGDPGRIGSYVQARLDDGYLFYAGHLDQVYVDVGARVEACAPLGTIGGVYHTHIKIASPDKPIPCEATGCDDFEQYWSER
jgi:murein DD-endopeptidase MepM/ murein hydrolase activator NlpD